MRESALELLAENLSDSLVAPLFWFLLLGLPGAALYRFANTADAMWGYRGRWEWAGKWAARADDVLSFIPARLTALALLGAAAAAGGLAALAREARRTASPNSGWPMAALALALGVRLGKPGVYVLNPAGAVPGPADLRRGLRRAALAGTGLGAAGRGRRGGGAWLSARRSMAAPMRARAALGFLHQCQCAGPLPCGAARGAGGRSDPLSRSALHRAA